MIGGTKFALRGFKHTMSSGKIQIGNRARNFLFPALALVTFSVSVYGGDMSVEFAPDMSMLPGGASDFCSESPGISALDPAAPPAPLSPGFHIITFPGQRRMFGVIPNYRASQHMADYKPLTTREKYTIARKDSFDWPNFPILFGYAVQNQIAAGGFTHNGGVRGFAEYYSRSVADNVIGTYVTEAILPSLLHEDPRFFRYGQGPVFARARHAIATVFITLNNAGQMKFNISEVVGNAGVAAIGRLYNPEGSFASEALEHWGLSLGNDMMSNLLTEFWPDIKRHMLPHHAKANPIP